MRRSGSYLLVSLLAAAAAAAGAAGAAGKRSLQFEAYGAETGAVCNDGSASGLYFDAATASEQSDVWVVQMQGGGWCWDGATCAKRTGDLTSSKNWPAAYTPEPGSILAATGTDFASANVAYQRYCTSDGYIGNATASAATNGMAFRGHAVVLAALDLLAAKGMGRTGNSTLVFSGCSAGGRGVLHNANRVGALAAARGVTRFAALVDSGLYIDVDPLKGATPALRVQAQGVASYLRAAIDPACAAHYGGGGGDQEGEGVTAGEAWKCLLGEYAIPTLRVPYVLNAFQADRFQLGATDFGSYLVPASAIRADAAESAYAENFRNRTRAALFAALARRDGTAARRVAVHSADCYDHCNTEGAGFSGAKDTVSGVSLASVVQGFVFGESSGNGNGNGNRNGALAIDNCTGTFACGAGCGL